MESSNMMAVELRQNILRKEIEKYVRNGYRVICESQSTALLIKPNKFSLFWAIVWFMLAVLPFVIYILWYNDHKEKWVCISVNVFGKVIVITS